MARARVVLLFLVAAMVSWSGAAGLAQERSQGSRELLFAEFDARPLTDSEKRFIQIALAHTGDYVGLFDGKWGRRSQEALEAYSMREFDTFIVPNIVLAALSDLAFAEEESNGFADRRIEALGLELRLPFKRMQPVNEQPWAYAWQAINADLFVALAGRDFTSPDGLHEAVSREFGFAAKEYLVRRDDRLVTSHRGADGTTIYLRSDRGPLGWVSFLVISGGSTDPTLFQAIVSSFYVGPPRPSAFGPMPNIMAIRNAASSAVASLEDSGDQDRTIAPTSRNAGTREKRVKPDRSGPDEGSGGSGSGSGSGFYVDPTHVVTNNHVIEECDGLAMSEGAPLLVVAQDSGRDLALLRARDSATTWLSIAQQDAGLGANLFVLGYPYYQTFSGSITATRGVMSSRTGLLGSANEFTLSAQIQPGNSGGPVMNQSGEVVGVVVARISDAAVAQLTGSIPQNINYAVSRESLVEFLNSEGVTLAAAARTKRVNLDDGIPVSHEAAVIPISCLKSERR